MRTIVVWLAAVSAGGCYAGPRAGDDGDDSASDGEAGEAGDDDDGESGADDGDAACEPVMPRFVARIPDRHVAATVATLLGIPKPTFTTSPSDPERFVPDKAAVVTGAVAVKFQAMAEAAAAEATAPGQPLVLCESGDESACADRWIDELASRAFRRAATQAELDGLRQVYEDGVEIGGDHAAGIRLVLEAILQAPAFIYEIEAPPGEEDRYALSSEQLAARISFFLTDTIADAELWQAARDGELETEEQLAAQVDRILATPEGRAQLRRTFNRFFDVHRISELSREGVDPALFAAMRAETEGLVDDVLASPDGSLADLLLSRDARVDDALAVLYGVQAPTDGASVSLPEAERAGILTRAGIMALKSTSDESSVIHRGLLVARNLLCVSPPPPDPENVAEGEEINAMFETERERMLARRANATCATCHETFDPLGVTFEHYDNVGRFRTEIATSTGPVPVDSSWKLAVLDLQGNVADAVELSALLAESPTVHACVAEKLVGYAVGHGLEQPDRCAVEPLAEEFDASGGGIAGLVRAIALWPGLRERRGGGE
jgi:hypothetical protein